MVDNPVAFELKHITKRFGNLVANDSVDLKVRFGEVHGLLGENGAGKSTLMNILYGMYAPTSGEVVVKGKAQSFQSPQDAMKIGIQMVHQHFMLALPFKAWENVVLGNEPTRHGLINVEEACNGMIETAKRLGFSVDPFMTVADMTIAMRQKLEIIRALYKKCDIMILDEPTAVLSAQETDELIRVIRQLRNEQKAVVIITHKLREVMEICDRVTVLRRGKLIESQKIEDVTIESLATAMVGRPVIFELPDKKPVQDAVGVFVNQLSTGKTKADLKDVSFQIKSGEIYGIAGVENNGQKALVEALLGLKKVTGGSITVFNKAFIGKTPAEIGRYVAHVAEDRHSQSFIGSFSVLENVMLGRQREKAFVGKLSHINGHKWKSTTNEVIEKFDVRIESLTENASSLSGGNQQKLVVGREFTKPEIEVVIAEQPSRGLDIASSEYVQQCLVQMRNQGKCVLLISADLDELTSVSDRIGILYEGRLVKEGAASDFDNRSLGLYMTGGAQ